MQCFQKDPNLRVSARKLLKHPWIVNARRCDSVVQARSTEYEEAVKSVQEWNEALRSPNSSTLRKPLRSDTSPPPPGQKDSISPLNIPASREPLSGLNTNIADKFRSHEDPNDDNWDEDFVTAISPSALQLPHLKPQDNFGGLLSSEKLKAFASLEGAAEPDATDGSSSCATDIDEMVRHDPVNNESDPLETIRPYSRRAPEGENSPPKYPRRLRQRQQQQQQQPSPGLRTGPIVAPISGPTVKPHQPRPAAFYKESSIEDYSDLIAANDDVLESKLAISPVSIYRD